MVVDTHTQVVTPDTTQVVTPILRMMVSSGVFENPPNPFLIHNVFAIYGALAMQNLRRLCENSGP